MDENIDEYTKMILMLEVTNQTLGEVNETMILLNSLPSDYKIVNNVLQYNGSVPKFDLVVARIKARELELNALKSTRNGSNLYTKGKTKKKKGVKGNDLGNSSSKEKDKEKGKKNKAKNSRQKCYHCGKEGHI